MMWVDVRAGRVCSGTVHVRLVEARVPPAKAKEEPVAVLGMLCFVMANYVAVLGY